MRSHKRDQAAVSVIVPKGGIRGNDGAQAGGLMGRESIASRADDYKIQSVAALI